MFLVPHARQKYEMNGTQKIKCIIFDKSGMKFALKKKYIYIMKF